MSSNRNPKIYDTPLSNSEDKCDDLDFTTTLQKIQEAALSGLSEGDVLKVQLKLSPITVEVVNYKNEVCGIVDSPDIDQLVTCLKKGVKFQAEVRGVRGVVCVVRIASTLK